MNYIIQNGLGSKNTILDTERAISLALSAKDLSGVSLQLEMTKDNVIVVACEPFLKNHPKVFIRDLTLQELQHYNLGNRVRKEAVLTLQELLKHFENNPKEFIFTLPDQQERNTIFVDHIFEEIKAYPQLSIFLKSSVKELVLSMKEKKSMAKIGAIILDTSPYFWNLDLDFYCFVEPELYVSHCMKKIENHRFMMVESTSEGSATFMISQFSNYLNQIFLIFSDQSNFTSIYPVCQNMISSMERIE